jgi:hypothetical protein
MDFFRNLPGTKNISRSIDRALIPMIRDAIVADRAARGCCKVAIEKERAACAGIALEEEREQATRSQAEECAQRIGYRIRARSANPP